MMNIHEHIDLLYRFERGLLLREAIFEAVKDGSRVLDAGCGTGLLSIWAAQAGAQHVLAIDNAHLELARALIAENGCTGQIDLLRSDLANPQISQDRFDVILALVYYNDPRRDEAQSAIVFDLCKKFLAQGGKTIPDRVTYTACAVDWRAYDLASQLDSIDRKIDIIENHYGLKMDTLTEASRVPELLRAPIRQDSGLLDREDAVLLSAHTPFSTVECTEMPAYPKNLTLQISRSGVFSAVLFVQNLYFEDRLLFSNESLSWVSAPLAVSAGTAIDVIVDENYRKSNAFSIRTAESVGLDDGIPTAAVQSPALSIV